MSEAQVRTFLLGAYIKVARAIEDFWLNLVMLPQDDDNDS